MRHPDRPGASPRRARGVPPDGENGVAPGAAASRPGRPSDTDACSVEFPAELSAVRQARHFTAGVLAGWRLDAMIDDATLVVNELATNALLHARSGFRLDLSRQGGRVRVAVSDTGRGTATPRVADGSATTGRGLELVAVLAAAWGEDAVAGGKEVWAVLEAGDAAPAGDGATGR